MVMITWTPQLSHAVKEVKKLEKSRITNLSNERRYLNSLGLSPSEVQAVNLVITRNSLSVETEAYWS